MEPAPGPKLKTFQDAFCERCHCSREEFAKQVFWRSLYRHAIPLAWLIMLFNRGFFDPDFRSIRRLADATSTREILAEAHSFRVGYHSRARFLRDVLRIRLSGKRLLRLAGAVMR